MDFQKIYGRANGFFIIATVIATPLGSLVFKFYPRIPYFFSFLVFLIAAIVLSQMRWEFTKKTPTISNYINTLMTGIQLTLKNRLLLGLAIIGIALTVTRMLFNQNINQPYLLFIGIDVAFIGLVAALGASIQALINIYAHNMYEKIGSTKSLVLLILIPAIATIALAQINNLLALIFIFFLYSTHAFRDPIFTHLTHKIVQPDKRATMASTLSFITSISVGILLPFFGSGIDKFGIQNILFLLGIFILVIGGGGLSIFLFSKNRSSNHSLTL